MEQGKLQEILYCLQGQNRTKFYYHKDRYALMLLSYYIGKGMKTSEIKNGKLKRLLEKPLVKEVLKQAGNRIVTPQLLETLWPRDFQCYLITLGRWGGRFKRSRFYNQTSRPGWNLVLQLNFSEKHNRDYLRLIKPNSSWPFAMWGHPISGKGYTLAWARIDLDLDTNEALIEEIQTDWIRLALRAKKFLDRYGEDALKDRKRGPSYIRGLGCGASGLNDYVDTVLKPHLGIWQEATLMSAIWFLKEEVGIENIFYHTYDVGCRIKRIEGTRPPRSLYTKLPEKFCFEKTRLIPSFLNGKNNRKAVSALRRKGEHFYLLTV